MALWVFWLSFLLFTKPCLIDSAIFLKVSKFLTKETLTGTFLLFSYFFCLGWRRWRTFCRAFLNAESLNADAISSSTLADKHCTTITEASYSLFAFFPSNAWEMYWWCFTKFNASSIVSGCSKQACFAVSLSVQPRQNLAIASFFRWSSGKSTNAGVANVITRSAQSSNDSFCFWKAWQNFPSRSQLTPSRQILSPAFSYFFWKNIFQDLFSLLWGNRGLFPQDSTSGKAILKILSVCCAPTDPPKSPRPKFFFAISDFLVFFRGFRGVWVKCVTRTRVGKPALGFYESLKIYIAAKQTQ